MLTPSFKIDQNNEFLLLTIKAPYVKSNDVEIYINEKEFKFYVKPYFLRLYFPCEVVENGKEYAKYDISAGIFSIKVPKKNDGEVFPNLDMLTTLLAPKKGFIKNPLIEVVNEEASPLITSIKENISGDEDSDDSLCWEIEQNVYVEQTDGLITSCHYGFANQYSGVFQRLQDEIYEIIDLPDPEKTSLIQRREIRIAREKEKFDKDHYLADYFDENSISHILHYKAPWDTEVERLLKVYADSGYPEVSGLINPKGNVHKFHEDTEIAFTEHEKNRLLQLPNKEFLLSKEEEQSVFLNLVDIIFAYSYNHRTMEGENSSESAWTVVKLSPSLNWFDSFKNIADVITNCSRRSLCYPLYRSWNLLQVVLRDVKRIFMLGKKWILRCLLDVYEILSSDENKYILNDIYVTDLCVWIQTKNRKKIMSLANKLQCFEISKDDVDLSLCEIEKEAHALLSLDTDSGSEVDSSSDSDVEDSETSTDSNTESCLDSDDISECEDEHCNDETLNNEKPLLDMQNIDAVDHNKNVEIICTGMEELLTINKHVESLQNFENQSDTI